MHNTHHTTDEPLSLIQTLKDRADTGFGGESTATAIVTPETNTVTDDHGNEYTQPHDYLQTTTINDDPAGILVADYNNKHSFDHDYSHLPHPIGLFVKEQYRDHGIATELLQNFMNTAHSNTCVIDCKYDLTPFYEQLNCEVIYARPLKDNLDVSEYHELLRTDPQHRNTTPSPEHNVPLFDSYETRDTYKNNHDAYGDTPFIRIHAYEYPRCVIAVDMPHNIQGDNRSYHQTLTEDAAAQINSVLEPYQDKMREYEFTATTIDFFRFPAVLPDTARELADDLYPILTNKTNLEPEQQAPK